MAEPRQARTEGTTDRDVTMVPSAMAGEGEGATDPVALRDARERIIQQLSDAFARDDCEIEDFERRLTLAHRTETQTDATHFMSCPHSGDCGSLARSRSSPF